MGLVAGHQFILLELQVIFSLLMEKNKGLGGERLSPKRRLAGLSANTPWASTPHRSRTAEGGRRNERRLSFARRSGAPLLAEQGESWGAIVASWVGLGYRGHTLGGKCYLEGHLCGKQSKRCKVSFQGGRAHLVPVGSCRRKAC